jgi:hypothetical protein
LGYGGQPEKGAAQPTPKPLRDESDARSRISSRILNHERLDQRKEIPMRIAETKRTGGCTCRCNACKSQAHCKNIGSGCKVKL